MYIWNDGVMPTNLTTTEKLFQKHSSKPYNPKLADIFFKSGMIEAWGRGFDKIKEACQKYDGPLPEYDISEDGIMVLCKACERYLKILHGEINPVQSERDDEQDTMKAIVIFCANPKSSQEIMEHFGIPNRSYFKRHYLDKLVKTNKLKMTIPEKPSSKNQKYYS
jgi:ATP-dependent DNA helicase RecG